MEGVLEAWTFYALSAVAVGGALLVVTVRNTMHGALYLGLSLAAVAGLFASLGADFLFAAQILVYVSGVAVLILFVVLLSGRASDRVLRQVNEQWLLALPVCALLFAALLKIGGGFAGVLKPGEPYPITRPLAHLLLGDYGLPFELVSVILLAALLGAVLFSHLGDRAAEEEHG